jgi:hypothetical protein
MEKEEAKEIGKQLARLNDKIERLINIIQKELKRTETTIQTNNEDNNEDK